MSSANFDNLVKTGQLKTEPMHADEIKGLINSGEARLVDANKIELSFESRFDLPYNAAHAFSLAALRWHGYRPTNRYIVFQLLPQTLNLGSSLEEPFYSRWCQLYYAQNC
jgi:hypothetical protein